MNMEEMPPFLGLEDHVFVIKQSCGKEIGRHMNPKNLHDHLEQLALTGNVLWPISVEKHFRFGGDTVTVAIVSKDEHGKLGFRLEGAQKVV